MILCERGIRTFETSTRNTLDLSAIPVVKKLSHLPIIVDPSHGTGLRAKVSPMALAAVAAGADGITVEVHTDPEKALSDGPQSLYPEQFEKLMRDIEAMAPVLGKELGSSQPGTHPGAPRTRQYGARGSAQASGTAAPSATRPVGSLSGDAAAAVPLPTFRSVFDAIQGAGAASGWCPWRTCSPAHPRELRPAAAVRPAHHRRAEDPHRAQPDRAKPGGDCRPTSGGCSPIPRASRSAARFSRQAPSGSAWP